MLSDSPESGLPAFPAIGCDEPGDSPKIGSSDIASHHASGPLCEVRRKPVDRVEGEVVVAMAFRKPVIGTALGGIADIEEGVTRNIG